MKRFLCSILLLAILITGLTPPAFAVQDETPASTEAQAEPVEKNEAPERTAAKAVSAEGLAMIDELGEGSYGGSRQLMSAEAAVNDFQARYGLSLSQTQFDALADFVMAYGNDVLSYGYQIEKMIGGGVYTDVELANLFCSWVYMADGSFSQQLLNRRLREIKLFLYGSYTGECQANFRYVLYEPQEGTFDGNSVRCYAHGGIYGALPAPVRDGYVFLGWYNAPVGGSRLLENDVASENRIVYARWTTPHSFTDVPSSAWYYNYVMESVEAGLFTGVSATSFDPEGHMSRAMLVTVLYRLAGTPAATTQAPFTDVPAGEWYSDAVNWAYASGVVKGVSETSFALHQNVTREQLTTMLYRYASANDYDTSAQAGLSAFVDAGRVAEYAQTAVRWAVAVGIVNGDGHYHLLPDGSATRAQCAKMMTVFLSLKKNGGTVLPPDPVQLHTSEAAIEFIKKHEGFISMPVWDYGQYSIGYGSRCDPEDYPNGITEEQADYLLRTMIVEIEASVDRVLQGSTAQHTQAQYDAIVSFTYNLGLQWVSEEYYIYRYFLYGGFDEMSFVNTMGSWCRAGGSVLSGLCRRRMDEANLYLYGDYTVGTTRYLNVIFNGAGGVSSQDVGYYRTGERLGELPTATREGYRFLGWYDRVAGGLSVTADNIAPAYGSYTLYAHWEKLP